VKECYSIVQCIFFFCYRPPIDIDVNLRQTLKTSHVNWGSCVSLVKVVDMHVGSLGPFRTETTILKHFFIFFNWRRISIYHYVLIYFLCVNPSALGPTIFLGKNEFFRSNDSNFPRRSLDCFTATAFY